MCQLRSAIAAEPKSMGCMYGSTNPKDHLDPVVMGAPHVPAGVAHPLLRGRGGGAATAQQVHQHGVHLCGKPMIACDVDNTDSGCTSEFDKGPSRHVDKCFRFTPRASGRLFSLSLTDHVTSPLHVSNTKSHPPSGHMPKKCGSICVQVFGSSASAMQALRLLDSLPCGGGSCHRTAVLREGSTPRPLHPKGRPAERQA